MFFDDLRRLANNAIALNADNLLRQIFLDKNFQKFIIDLNRREQLFLGINSLGIKLDSYSPVTEELNKGKTFTFQGESKKKIAGEPIIVFDTGEVYDSFTLEAGVGSITIDADTIKDGDDLLKTIDANLLGLTDEHLQLVIDALREKLIPILLELLQA